MPRMERLFQYMVRAFGGIDKEPSSTDVLGHVADFSREDFTRAIKIADKGFRKYSTTTSFPERGAQLRRWYDLIIENLEDCKYYQVL
jgi:acyl-CoA reductase-like NAD-dependent aldehyde dehydrogenase